MSRVGCFLPEERSKTVEVERKKGEKERLGETSEGDVSMIRVPPLHMYYCQIQREREVGRNK
jgi:hypothetical protein